MISRFTAGERIACLLFAAILAFAVVFYIPASHANPIAEIPPLQFTKREVAPLANALKDLTDPTRGGQWGRASYYGTELLGNPWHSMGIAVGAPTFLAGFNRARILARGNPSTLIALDYFEAGFQNPGAEGKAHVDWFGVTSLSGDQNIISDSRLWMLGVRYLVTSEPLDQSPQYQNIPIREIATDADSLTRGFPDYFLSFDQSWPGWQHVAEGPNFHIYTNPWAWRRAEFIPSHAYSDEPPSHRGANRDGRLYIHEPWRISYFLFSDRHDDYLRPWGNPRVNVVKDDGANIVIEAAVNNDPFSSPSQGIIVFNEPIVDGWTATVDSQPATIRSVEGILMAVEVQSGNRRIEFHHPIPPTPLDPASPPALLIAAAALLLLLSAGLLLYLHRARKAMYDRQMKMP